MNFTVDPPEGHIPELNFFEGGVRELPEPPPPLTHEKQGKIGLGGFTSDCVDLWYDYTFLCEGKVVPR